MYSIMLVCLGFIFLYFDFETFVDILAIIFMIYSSLCDKWPKQYVLLISTIFLIFPVYIINPSILGTVSLSIELCFSYIFSLFSFLVSLEAVPKLFLLFQIYYFVLFKARFKIKKYSKLLNMTSFVLPFLFGYFYLLWPNISSFTLETFKILTAITTVTIGLKFFIW